MLEMKTNFIFQIHALLDPNHDKLQAKRICFLFFTAKKKGSGLQ